MEGSAVSHSVDEFEATLAELDELLQETRSQRFTVYIEPTMAEAANKLEEDGPFETISVVLDTALRRQLLHELQLRPEYAHLLEELEALPACLVHRASSRHSPADNTFIGTDPDGAKVVMSGRTTPGLYLLEKMLIEDRRVEFDTESGFVEAGLRRLRSPKIQS